MKLLHNIQVLVFIYLSVFTCSNTLANEIRIVLIGDSTVTDYEGWGKSFAGRFNSKVKVYNFSLSGKSSKSYYVEKRLSTALSVKPHYVFIQFGHNDQPGKGKHRETDPSTTFKYYLKKYINNVVTSGAQPVLISSMTRRNFDKNGNILTSLTPWAVATGEVAKSLNIPFIDLHTASIKYHNIIGYNESMKFNAYKKDKTHLNRLGAEQITDLIIKEMKLRVIELSPYIR